MDVIIWNSGAVYQGFKPILRSLGAYKAGQILRNKSYNVQVIDFVNHLNFDQLYNATKKFITGKTLCLSISTTFITQIEYLWPNGQKIKFPYHIYQCLKKIKEERPFLKIVLGGYNSELIPSYNIIDAHISSYAEDIFYELIDYYRTGKNEPIFVIDKRNNRKSYTAAQNNYYNIKTDRHIFTDNDCIMPGESLPIEISRGCIFKCKFCNHLLLGRHKDEYLRNIELVTAEIKHNYHKWQTTNYFITCDTFNDNQEKMQAWHDSVTSLDFKINFACYLRADLLHRFGDSPYQLKQSGLLSAFHGIESLDKNASYAIGKAWSGKHAADYIPKLYHDIWQKQVYQHLGFIIGLPGETKESILSTADWFIKNDLYQIEFNPLGINKNWTIGTSEFSKNYHNYGYKFKDDSDSEWYNDYWSYTEMKTWHTNILRPYILPHKSWFGSWYIIGLRTLGYDMGFFDKSYQKLNNRLDMLDDINQRSSKWISDYHLKLMSL